jgi:allantoicase
MDNGWETRRRRDKSNDWISYRLAEQGLIRAIEIDTGCYKGNAPGWASLQGRDDSASDSGEWFEILPRTSLQPDTVHRFLTGTHGERPVTHVRLDIYPDGGVARLRLHGSLTDAGADRLAARWHALR